MSLLNVLSHLKRDIRFESVFISTFFPGMRVWIKDDSLKSSSSSSNDFETDIPKEFWRSTLPVLCWDSRLWFDGSERLREAPRPASKLLEIRLIC